MRVDFNEGKPVCKIYITTNRNEIYAIETSDVTTQLYQTEKSYLSDDIIFKMKEEIVNSIQSAFKECQNNGVDVLQIGNRLYRQNPNKWRDFVDEYGQENYIKHITLEVEVKIKKQI